MFSNRKQSHLADGEMGDKLATEKGEYSKSENQNGPFGVSSENRIKFDKSKFQTLGTDNGRVFQQNQRITGSDLRTYSMENSKSHFLEKNHQMNAKTQIGGLGEVQSRNVLDFSQ